MPAKRAARAGAQTPLSRQRALEAAVAIADADGIAAVTMRRLASALGVEAMSLYHHVANKDDILDGMVDMVFAEIELPTTDDDWATAMRRRAESMRSALNRHPWSVSLMDSRSSPGPATLRHHDAVIGCCRRAGFSIAMAARVFALLDSYIYGFVLQEVNLPVDNDDEVADIAEAMLPTFVASELPYLVDFTVEHVLRPGYRFADEFDYGLELIIGALDTVERT